LRQNVFNAIDGLFVIIIIERKIWRWKTERQLWIMACKGTYLVW